MRHVFLWTLVFISLCVVSFSYAWAQATATPDDPDALLELYRAIIAGKWGWLAGFALMGAIEPAKRILMRHRWLSSDLGGLALAFVMATIAGTSHALISGAAWTPDLGIAIVRNAVVAIGGYTVLKRTLAERLGLANIAKDMPKAPLPTARVVSGTTGT